MTWPAALGVVLLAAAWLTGPGLLVGKAAGLRGLTAWGAAPLLSVGLVAGSALLGGELGVPWSPLVPLLTTTVVALAIVGLCAARRHRAQRAVRGEPRTATARHDARPRTPHAEPGTSATFESSRERERDSRSRRTDRVSRARCRDDANVTASRDAGPGPAPERSRRLLGARAGRRSDAPPDGPWARAAAVAGSVVAAGLGLVTAVSGMGRPDAVSQTFDASFHYNAVARILATGDASAITLGGLVNSPAPYPAAWHAVVSLVAPYAGAGGIVTASNMVALAVVAVAWPAGCLLLVRQLAGRSAGAALATPVLALGFGAFPWALVTYGALWPNLLGVALMPAATALALTLAGLARHSELRRRGALVLAVVAVPTVALGHPNAVFGLAVVAFWPLAWGLAAAVVRAVRARRWIGAAALTGAGVAVAAGTYWVMVVWPALDGIRAYTWDPVETTRSGVLSVLTSSPNGRTAAWAISALVLAGAVAALRRWHTSWLVPAWLTTGALYVLAASTTASPWTGVWYNDSPRLAAMVPVLGVPLAVLGTLALAGLARRLASVLPRPGAVRPAVAAGAGVALLVVASGGLYQRSHAEHLAEIYQHPAETLLLPGQEDFLIRAGELLPADAVVAQNPWTGNALLWTLTDRQVLFPHLTGVWSPEQRIVAERLRDAATDPSVCAAVRATGTGYALTGPLTLWSWDPLARTFPGLDDLDGVPGFELMAGDGDTRLYRITACEPYRITDS